jgi:C4-dicarboxylate transporter DctQ subunit
MVSKVNTWLVGILSLVMVFSVFINIVNRVIVQAQMSWTEEIARYAMIWMTYLTVGIGIRKGAHLGVEMLVSKFRPQVTRAVSLFAHTCSLAFCLVVVFFALEVLQTQRSFGQASAALQIPMWTIYAAVPVGMLLAAIEEMKALVRVVTSPVESEAIEK